MKACFGIKACSGIVVGLLALCLCCPPVLAGAEIYILGGPGLSDLTGDTNEFGHDVARSAGEDFGGFWTADQGMKVGIDAGVGVSYALASGLGVAGELRYVSRGTSWQLTEVTELKRDLDASMNLHYLEIPVLVQYSLPMTGRMGVTFQIGPVLGIRLSSATARVSPGFQAPDENIGPDVMESNYVSGLVGVGFRLHTAGKHTFLMQTRFKGQFPTLARESTKLDLRAQDFTFLLGVARAL